MVGGFFISNCVSNNCTLPIVPSVGNSYTAARIVAAGSGTVGGCTATAVVLCLESGWSGTGHSGQNYIIWNPNTSVIICDGCLGSSMNFDTFGHVWRNVAIDIAGVAGAVGYFSKACEERCEYDAFKVSMQVAASGSDNLQKEAGACAVWDGTLRGSNGLDTKQNNTGTGHASEKTMECVVGNNVGGTNSYGWVVTAYDLIQQKPTSGPNDFQIGTVVGALGPPNRLLADAVFLDGFNRGFFYGGHIESVSNDAIEVGLNNPGYGVTIEGIDYADTNANNVIEFHSGSLGNVAIGTRREIGGCIIADDNLATSCTASATSNAATQSEPLYAQAGNYGTAAVFGGITQSGNSTRLTSATAIGSTSFTSTNLAFPSVAPSTNVSFHCDIIWEQGFGVNNVTFGMGMNNAPTSLWVESQIYNDVSVAPSSQYTTITSTTTTPITAATTPVHFSTPYVLTLFGVLSTSSSNSVVLTVYGKSGNATDTLIVEPGSTCFLTP